MGVKKGNVPWNKNGAKYSKKALKNMSLGQKKRFEKEDIWNKGKITPEETREKISKRLKGRTPWNKGKKYPQITGENNHNWKGDNVGYGALHHWVSRHKKKTGICKKCDKKRKTHWANISGKYKRDLDDWKELCPKCHKKFDGKQKRM